MFVRSCREPIRSAASAINELRSRRKLRRAARASYANSLVDLRRFEEARSLLRTTMPVARRSLGEGHTTTLRIRWVYAQLLCKDANTLDDLREALNTFEETSQTARRVLGVTHPITTGIECELRRARAALRPPLAHLL